MNTNTLLNQWRPFYIMSKLIHLLTFVNSGWIKAFSQSLLFRAALLMVDNSVQIYYNGIRIYCIPLLYNFIRVLQLTSMAP